MSRTDSWTANRSASGNTEFISLRQDGKSLTFGQMFSLLRGDGEFGAWYTRLLRDSPFAAYFWEHPPLDRARIDATAEFVLVDAPMLKNLQPDATPFRSHFGTGDIAVFPNLGGDATLIAPAPDDSSPGYAHLAAFLDAAPARRIRALWRNVAETVVKSLADKPIWLSTSGLGVAWLHVRLDSSPKYYQHGPYRRWPHSGEQSLDRSIS